MLRLAGHTLLENIWKRGPASVYRGYRDVDRVPVMVKTPRSEYPEPRELAKLENEYQILRELVHPGIVRVFGLESVGYSLALILEDIAGQSLHEHLEAGRLDLGVTLRLGGMIARALDAIHQGGVLHKDINPQNLIYNAETGEVKIIDFGIATRLGREIQRAARPEALEGTLAYIAPEQTGRLDRDTDHRADLYSLGATLYHMLTGALPFQKANPIELIHSHIAQLPAPPRELVPEIPAPVSDCVLKLLEKEPELRYQSARGLAWDLERLRERWEAGGPIEPMPLGQRDVGAALCMPQRVYGRDAEVQSLLASLDRAREGRPEMVLITGAAGVGKSALVQEVHRAIARSGGQLVASKFDQIQRDRPFWSLTQAFGALIRQLLAGTPESLSAWRDRLTAALGPDGQVLVDLLPELELVLGRQPPAASLGPIEAQARFGLVFQRFARVFCEQARPLALFLDDLQWADPASISMLPQLLTDPEGAHLLIIGAYRDQEVGEAHPLRGALRTLRNEGCALAELRLAPLELSSLRQLLRDALVHVDEAPLEGLAEQVFAKAHGNPLFTTRLLAAWQREGLLSIDPGSDRWTWEAPAIAAAPVADNVVEFLTGRLSTFEPDTRRLLAIAACIGHEFDRATLSSVARLAPAAVAGKLLPAIREGLIVPLNAECRLLPPEHAGAAPAADFGAMYLFLHDRVQQAAYSLVSTAEQQALHLALGRRLREGLTEDSPVEALFNVVNHLNLGAPEVRDREEQQDQARLNLTAGQAAKAAAACGAAAGFFRAGIAMLGAPGCEDDHLLFMLRRGYAECEYLNGHFEQAEAELDRLMESAPTRQTSAELHTLRMRLCASQGRFVEGLALGLAGLALFDVDLRIPPDRLAEAFDAEVAEVDRRLAGRSIEALIEQPRLTDPDDLAIAALLIDVAVIGYGTDPRVAAVALGKLVNLSVACGHAAPSTFGYVFYGVFLTGMLGRFAEAIRFGRLGLALLEELRATEFECKSHCVFGVFSPHGTPLRASLAHFARAQATGTSAGDLMYFSMAFMYSTVAHLRAGCLLPDVEVETERALAVARRLKDGLGGAFATGVQELVRALRGPGGREGAANAGPLSLSTNDWIAHLDATSIPFVKLLFYLCKLQLLVWYEEYEEALPMVEGAERYASMALGNHWVTDVSFFASITWIALDTAAMPEARGRYDEALARHRARLADLAQACPGNDLHRKHLVDAEVARRSGDVGEALSLYEQAIAGARQSRFLQYEALANELCGKFHLCQGRSTAGRAYLVEARRCYAAWGADGKVEQLDRKYAALDLKASAAGESMPIVTTMTLTAREIDTTNFDLKGLVKALQSIASELIVERVLERMLRILTGSSGAQRGALVFLRAGAPVVEATVATGTDEVKVGLAEPLDDCAALPRSVVHYVVRTGEPLVLDAMMRDPRFSDDPYLVAHTPRAILCLPIRLLSRQLGVLYLENRFMHGAFPASRLWLLEILSTQAAIAVENARLYESLEGQVAARTEELRLANESLQHQLAEREQLREAHATMQEEIIRVQQGTLRELSTPLIPITDDVMVMPLIGAVDEARVRQLLETALEGAHANAVKAIIIDVTGVQAVGTGVAGALFKLVSALQMLGTHTIITGIRPAVAQTIVGLDLDLRGFVVCGSLKTGIAHALKLRAKKSAL